VWEHLLPETGRNSQCFWPPDSNRNCSFCWCPAAVILVLGIFPGGYLIWCFSLKRKRFVVAMSIVVGGGAAGSFKSDRLMPEGKHSPVHSTRRE
jgi:hypothetical protein